MDFLKEQPLLLPEMTTPVLAFLVSLCLFMALSIAWLAYALGRITIPGRNPV